MTHSDLFPPEPVTAARCRRSYPRLLHAMQVAAILSTTEASAALRDYINARDGFAPRDLMDCGGGEAVCHFGGPVAVIEAAASYDARLARRLWG